MRALAICLFGMHALASELSAPVDVAFTSRHDGTEQRYVRMLPEPFDAAQPHDVLIALHGHGSDRWQFARDERDECRAARDAAARHCMIYVSPDYRAKTSWMGPAAEADTVQLIDELRIQYRVGKVFVCGGSMGGTAALIIACRHPELFAGVVAMNGTANMVEYAGFQEAIAASYGGTKAEAPREYKARSAELHADRLTMPVAVTTGGNDEIVPAASVLRLAAALERLGRDVLSIYRPEGPHSTGYEDATTALAYVLSRAATPES